MKVIWRVLSAAIVASVLAGCSGESGESMATPDNPQAAIDALKYLPKVSVPKNASKGLRMPTPAK